PAHAKEFTMQVAVDGKELSTGFGRSKKLAEQAAAKSALEQLGN
ncbi:putative dsRNA-binding protein, partial [Streptococcus thermophilus]